MPGNLEVLHAWHGMRGSISPRCGGIRRIESSLWSLLLLILFWEKLDWTEPSCSSHTTGRLFLTSIQEWPTLFSSMVPWKTILLRCRTFCSTIVRHPEWIPCGTITESQYRSVLDSRIALFHWEKKPSNCSKCRHLTDRYANLAPLVFRVAPLQNPHHQLANEACDRQGCVLNKE